MREVLYKAKAKYNNDWVEGDLIQIKPQNKFFIHPQANPFTQDGDLAKLLVAHEVEEDTICQYIGLTDKNVRKIFEGDILTSRINFYPYVVKFEEGRFKIEDRYGNAIKPKQEAVSLFEMEVIGNIFDNPELLKQKEKKW